MSFGTAVLLIIIAGVINGSFVVPSKYVKSLSNEKIWLFHSLIGLSVLPWLLLSLASPAAFHNYAILQPTSWAFLIISGFIFGLGQLCFAYAIERVGIALSFTINLSLGITIGSLFVFISREAFFTSQGLLVLVAIILILSGLIINYFANLTNTLTHHNNLSYRAGWLLATIAGIASGLQNIAFVTVAYDYQSQLQTTDSYWVWPPFLTAAAIPMIIGFLKRIAKEQTLHVAVAPLQIMKNLAFISLMGLCFTGSLVLYSIGMNQLSYQQQIVGWPILMVAIILTSQFWGWLYKETKNVNRQTLVYRLSSISLLIIAIIILALK